MANPDENLVQTYTEGIIQLGFIVFFACVFPLAPLFSFLTNLLEINIKLNNMSKFQKRFIAKGASGIGSWAGVMELISMVSIPINVAILLFTTNGADETGDYGYSATVTYFLGNGKRTTFEVVLILVMIEHLLLGVKIIMATLIPDVPADVVLMERRRPKIEDLASQEIQDLKIEHQLKTVDELMEEIALEDVKKKTDALNAKSKIPPGDPEGKAAKNRKKAKLSQDIVDIQNKAIDQQKRYQKQDKDKKNALRRQEKDLFKERRATMIA